MKISEKIQRDKKQFQELPNRNSKITFIWDYYKVPILLILSVLAILLTIFISNIGRKDASMYVVLLNSDSSWRECDSTVFDKVLENSELDLKNKTVDINDKLRIGEENTATADVETLQVLTALFTISDLDLYVADKQYFDYFVEDAGYCDLSLLIDKEILEKHHDDLYYVTDSKGNTTLSGIVLHDGSLLHEAGYYHDDVIMGVPANAFNMDVAIDFIKLILS